MAMDFPNSPTVNQTFTVGDKTWKWSGTVWEIVVNRPAMRSVADTPPASPIVGDEWFNSLTGKTYTWFDSYWIEVNTNSVVGASGLNGVASASAPLVYNSTNNNISVQTDPSFAGKITSTNEVSIERSTADPWSVGFNVKKRGTSAGANNAVLNGSELGYHGFWGWDGSSYIRSAMIYASAEQNFSAGVGGAGLGFYTTALNSGGASERMRINASGHVTLPAQPAIRLDGNASNWYSESGNVTRLSAADSRGGFVWNATTGYLTVPVSGYYFVTFTTYQTGGSTLRRHINKNGGSFAMMHAYVPGDTQVTMSGMTYFNANDTISVYRETAVNCYAGPNHTYLTANFLG